MQEALKLLQSGQGSSVSVNSNNTSSISPGIYSSWDVHGTLNLAPGLYIVNGNISAGAQAQLVGAGVTIIMSGTLDTNGGSRLDLTAPRAGATAGIPGILFAGTSTGTNSFLGNSERPVAGVIYFPNADLKFGGTTSTGTSGTLGCTEIIAKTFKLAGTTDVTAAGCGAYGALDFGSLPGAAPITLVR